MKFANGSIPAHLFRDMSMAEAHDYLRARTSRRRFVKGLGALGAASAAGPFIWVPEARASGAEPGGLHVNPGDDPRNAMNLAWCTAGIVNAPRLDYGTDPSFGSTLSADTRSVVGHSPLYHHAQLSGLSAGTTYHYRAIHDGAVGVTGSFTTAPVAAPPFRFSTMGDMGATADGATITQRILASQPDCVFMVGDLCYADRLGGAAEPPPEFDPMQPLQDLAQWDLWFSQIEGSAAQTPWIFTVGNHEMEVGQGALGYDGFNARISVPGGGPGANAPSYVTRWSNVAFISLDANDVSYEITKNTGYTGGLQDAWLATTLAGLRSDPSIDFIVVGFHHCMYCTNTVHSSDGGPRDAWGALFDQYSVDLVINGHNHSYERTHAVRGGDVTRPVPVGGDVDSFLDGAIYVTAGAGGQAAYPSSTHPQSSVWLADGTREPEGAEWSSVRYLGDHSVLVVDVTPRVGSQAPQMIARALASDGTEIDSFTITRSVGVAVPAMPPGVGLGVGALLAAGGARLLRAREGGE